MKDLPLELAGLKEVFGVSAFVCPYCDGWELRDKPHVIIAKGATALHLARTLAGWTSHYSICTNGADDLTDAQRAELTRHHIAVFDSPIRRIQSSERLHLRIGSNMR